MTDAAGVPLAATVTAANVNDIVELFPLLGAVPPVGGKPGTPRSRPASVQGDRGYDSLFHRVWLRFWRIKPIIPKRRTGHGSGLGRTRWVVERTLSWLHGLRRLRIRYERKAELHEAFVKLGCSLICWRMLVATF